MELDKLKKAVLVNETLEFFESGVYEFKISDLDVPAGRKWFMRTDGSQFALINMVDAPQIACRFDVKQVDTFIPRIPTALKIRVWEDDQSELKCPRGTQTAFMEWVLRTECIVINYRDDLDYWEVMAGRLKRRLGIVFILFNRDVKPYLREIRCEKKLRQWLEHFPCSCSAILGRMEQVEHALAYA
ncbi:hypothetical protein [Cedecea lapagei]|uniref:hypothetical protein n=1 Tax=Cedecea lapagei TaxID=158823 RepID=UPI001BD11926|nr:hypothetical protein [Cedecea lapagei]